MHFSGLKLAFDTLVDPRTGKCKERIENKQRINFSESSYAVLRSDIEAFHLAQLSPGACSEGLSPLISRILIGFGPSASASIGQRIAQEMTAVNAALAPLSVAERKRAAELIAAEKRERLLRDAEERKIAVRNKGKGRPETVRLNFTCLTYLQSDEGMLEAGYYEDNIGTYLKAVVEEYVDLPYVMRERYFLQAHCTTVNDAIQDGRILKLMLYSDKKQNPLYLRPLEIMQDSERLYNYVVGMISTENGVGWRVGSVRLSSIASIGAVSGSGKLRKAELAELREAIAAKGVQFLSGTCTDEKIAVRFTEIGERMYQRNLHLRPRYLEKQDDRTYTFACTQDQAEIYFFKFGHHVKVLSPAGLAAKFGRKYASAAAQYGEKS